MIEHSRIIVNIASFPIFYVLMIRSLLISLKKVTIIDSNKVDITNNNDNNLILDNINKINTNNNINNNFNNNTINNNEILISEIFKYLLSIYEYSINKDINHTDTIIEITLYNDILMYICTQYFPIITNNTINIYIKETYQLIGLLIQFALRQSNYTEIDAKFNENVWYIYYITIIIVITIAVI